MWARQNARARLFGFVSLRVQPSTDDEAIRHAIDAHS